MIPISLTVSVLALALPVVSIAAPHASCEKLSHFKSSDLRPGDYFEISRAFTGGLTFSAGKDFFYFQNGHLLEPSQSKPREASCIIHLRTSLDEKTTLPFGTRIKITGTADNQGESFSFLTKDDPWIKDFECVAEIRKDGTHPDMNERQYFKIFRNKITVHHCK